MNPLKGLAALVALALASVVLVTAASAACWSSQQCSPGSSCIVYHTGYPPLETLDGEFLPVGEYDVYCGTACTIVSGAGDTGCTTSLYMHSQGYLCARANRVGIGCCATPCPPPSAPGTCHQN